MPYHIRGSRRRTVLAEGTHQLRPGDANVREIDRRLTFLRVSPHMLGQRRSLREVLRAHATLERSVPRMALNTQ